MLRIPAHNTLAQFLAMDTPALLVQPLEKPAVGSDSSKVFDPDTTLLQLDAAVEEDTPHKKKKRSRENTVEEKRQMRQKRKQTKKLRRQEQRKKQEETVLKSRPIRVWLVVSGKDGTGNS